MSSGLLKFFGKRKPGQMTGLLGGDRDGGRAGRYLIPAPCRLASIAGTMAGQRSGLISQRFPQPLAAAEDL